MKEVGEKFIGNTEVREFKGNKILVLEPETPYPFQFGATKAKMILDNLDSIKEFVKKYYKEKY